VLPTRSREIFPKKALAMRVVLDRAHGMPLFNVVDQGPYLCTIPLRIKAKKVTRNSKKFPAPLALLAVDVALKSREILEGRRL